MGTRVISRKPNVLDMGCDAMKTLLIVAQVCLLWAGSMIAAADHAAAQPGPPPAIQFRVDQQGETCICNDDHSVCACCVFAPGLPPFHVSCEILVDGEVVPAEDSPFIVLSPGRSEGGSYRVDEGDIAVMLERERERLTSMIALAGKPKSELRSLPIRDLAELRCHVPPGAHWIECPWPYSPDRCFAQGWTAPHDGSCRLPID